MIDIQKILDAPMLKEPWEHKIIDNFFPEEVFSKIRNAAKKLSNYAEEGKTKPVWMHEALDYGIEEDVVDSIIITADDILDNINDIKSKFSRSNSSQIGYFAMPKFGVSGKNFSYPIHSESNHKCLLFVIYIDPEVDRGTRLYKEKSEESFVKEIEWKPNRAFVMCPTDNDITWHNWANLQNPSRVTLNIFCEKLECVETSLLNSAKKDELKDLLWLYEQFGKNRLTSNKYD